MLPQKHFLQQYPHAQKIKDLKNKTYKINILFLDFLQANPIIIIVVVIIIISHYFSLLLSLTRSHFFPQRKKNTVKKKILHRETLYKKNTSSRTFLDTTILLNAVFFIYVFTGCVFIKKKKELNFDSSKI